jgi:hypothetical protein
MNNCRLHRFLAIICAHDAPEITYTIYHSAESYGEAKNFFAETFHSSQYQILEISSPSELPLASIFGDTQP